MSWKCINCGQKLHGKEEYCSVCAQRAFYLCKKCGKEMDNGKRKYCPVCSTENSEKRKKVLSGIGGAALTVVTVTVGILTNGKLGGGKS